MKLVFATFLFLVIGLQTGMTQCSPEVQGIMSAVESQLLSSGAYAVKFTLKQSFIGEATASQQGRLLVEDKKFRLDMQDQTFLSDGQSLWIIIPEAKEVQIMSLDDETGLGSLSPIDILNQYCTSEYLSREVDNTTADNKNIRLFEFTPNDKSDEVFKVRVSYNEVSKEIVEVKSFSKDGSRMTLVAHNYDFSPTYGRDDFVFDSKAHENYNLEDLR